MKRKNSHEPNEENFEEKTKFPNTFKYPQIQTADSFKKRKKQSFDDYAIWVPKITSKTTKEQ